MSRFCAHCGKFVQAPDTRSLCLECFEEGREDYQIKAWLYDYHYKRLKKQKGGK